MSRLDDRLNALAHDLVRSEPSVSYARFKLDEAVQAYRDYVARPPERVESPRTAMIGPNGANEVARQSVTPDRPLGTGTTMTGGAGEVHTFDPIGTAWDAVLIARVAGMSVGDELLRITGIRDPLDYFERGGVAGLRLVTDERVHRVRLVTAHDASPVKTIVSACGRSWPCVDPYQRAIGTSTPETENHPDRCDTCTPDGPPQHV